MITAVVGLTGWVWTVTAAEVAPPGMVTVPGRLAMEVLLLASVITDPAAGVSPFRVTVAVEVAPP
jgi:hypothetical protein